MTNKQMAQLTVEECEQLILDLDTTDEVCKFEKQLFESKIEFGLRPSEVYYFFYELHQNFE